MWEGPSWQEVVSGQSPPTKWPRVTTPPNRRQSILCDPNDSGLGDSFYSPPLEQKKNMKISPLRTPGSNRSTSFSPFGRFRVSSFSSPTMSDRALRLSNCDNVLDYKFCEETLEKNRGRLDIGKVASNAARSLNLAEAGGLIAEDPIDTKPDPALLETPSKGFSIEDSGVFDESFNLFANSPLKQLFLDFDQLQPGTSNSDPLADVNTFPDEPAPLTKRIKTENETEPKPLPEHLFAQPNLPAKRFLAPYSRRWLRYTTGATRAQREVTAAARDFLKQRRRPTAGPSRPF